MRSTSLLGLRSACEGRHDSFAIEYSEHVKMGLLHDAKFEVMGPKYESGITSVEVSESMEKRGAAFW